MFLPLPVADPVHFVLTSHLRLVLEQGSLDAHFIHSMRERFCTVDTTRPLAVLPPPTQAVGFFGCRRLSQLIFPSATEGWAGVPEEGPSSDFSTAEAASRLIWPSSWALT